jgi:protein arginine kinase
MQIADLLASSGEWLKASGPESYIVISSRVRLARNIDDIPFAPKMNDEHAASLLARVASAAERSALLGELTYFDLDSVSDIEKQFLLERHVVSNDFVNAAKKRGLFLRRDEACSVMVNEEDHLRLQVIKSGFDLRHAFELADRIDDEFGKNLSYAFLGDKGYLTSCPTNLGTGMRASCMLHLPALVITKRVNRILELIQRLSFTARGFWGEGTQAMGNFFQVSNQVTLGSREEEIVLNLEALIKQIVAYELEARNHLMNTFRMTVEDRIWRAYGILRHARVMTTAEALGHLSLVRLGVDLGVIEGLPAGDVNAMLLLIHPAHLQMTHGKELEQEDRDMLRASVLRGKLSIHTD